MTKFLAIVKREYIQRVRARMFVVMTLLGPLMLFLMTIVPGLMFSLKTGGDTRLAIVDQTAGEQVFATVRDLLVRSQIDEPDEFDKNIGTQIENQVNSNTSQRLQEAGNIIVWRVCR